MSDYNLSVIIPVYDQEKFLDSCLSSVAAQSLDGIEVIIVNDGSRDGSLDIARSFEQKNRHFHVINQENKGLSGARNVGLDRARGDYIAFLDSDDFIDPIMYEQLYKIALGNNAELVKCGAVLFDDNTGKLLKLRNDFETFRKIGSKKIRLEAYLQKKIMRNVWNGIYSRRLFNELRFPEGTNYEDHYVTPYVLACTNALVYIPENFYYYRKHSGGITRSSTVEDRVDKVQSLNELYRLIVAHNLKDELSYAYCVYFYQMIIEFHNSVIYSDPFSLKKTKYSVSKLLDEEVFKYVISQNHLKPFETRFLKQMRRSHYLYFLLQKLSRVKEVIFEGDALFKKAKKKSALNKETLSNRKKELLKVFAKY